MVQQHPTSKVLIKVLVDARVESGMTQRQLAIKLGRQHSFVSKIESSVRNISVIEFIEVARALNADPAKLLVKVIKATGL